MLSVTTIAIVVVKIAWIHLTGIPLEEAKFGYTADSVSWLLNRIQNTQMPMNTIASKPISKGVTDKISPIKNLLYFVKLPPPKVAINIPKATAPLENTPMIVSAVWVLRFFT